MTPLHPNASLDQALDRRELYALLVYEGLLLLDPRDFPAARQLTYLNTAEMGELHGQTSLVHTPEDLNWFTRRLVKWLCE